MARPATGAALCVDGTSWLTREALAAAVAAALPDDPGGTRLAGGVAVPAAEPLGTLTTLLAVRALPGAVPVVVDPDLDPAAVGHLVALADRLPASEPLLVVQTSGTSSRPRAVVRTVASWDDSLDAFTGVAGLGRDDVVWAPGGLSSTLTLFAAWHALATGLPLLATGRWRGVVASGPATAAATVVHCVPAVLADVLDAHDAGLVPALRTAVVAGAALPRRLRERTRAAGVRLVEYYGAAELSFVAVDPDGTGLRPFPGADVALHDGVVRVRSPYVARGYLDPDDAGPFTRDADDWCSVGDRGRTVGDRLEVAGRGGEAVTVGGRTVVAADVEAALRDVPGVAELVCVGEPHARLGERVVLAVEIEPGSDPVPALREAARRALPPAARPVRYVVLAELPRTAGGKVARAALREVVTRAGRGGGRAAQRRVGAPRTPAR